MALPMVLAVGCASMGDDGGRDRISLQANRLNVPLAEKKPRKGTKDEHYRLYRLRLPQEAAKWRESSARLLVKKRQAIHIYIEERPVTDGVARDGWVTFELPSNLEVKSDCFIMVNSGDWATPRGGEKTFDAKYLIGLEPFAALAELELARRNLNGARRRIEEASRELPLNRAFVKDACTMPKVVLPARPHVLFNMRVSRRLTAVPLLALTLVATGAVALYPTSTVPRKHVQGKMPHNIPLKPRPHTSAF